MTVLPAGWVPSRKLLTAVVTNLLTLGVSLVVAHFGLHESSLVAGEVSALISVAAGAIAGYLVREIPRLEAPAAE